MYKIARPGLILLVIGAATAPAFGESEFIEAFQKHFALPDNSPMISKSCGICHVSDSDFAFNPYGRDLKAAIATTGSSGLTAKVFEATDTLDSDGDGTPNVEELKADGDPGDPAKGGKPGVTAAPQVPSEPKPAKFPPKNGYHPAIVHFPIALFVAGLFLDFLGLLKKNKELLFAGWINLVLASVSTLGGIASGVWAMALMKLPYRGLIFEHITYAVVSSAIIAVMVAMRLHRHEKMNLPLRVVYYILAAACLFLISWAGHLGGVFVYGE